MDSSGFRFYVTDQLRQYDIGYLTLGTDATAASLVLPPQTQNFTVDSFCPGSVTSVCTPDLHERLSHFCLCLQTLPATGITVINAFPHTHLQGKFRTVLSGLQQISTLTRKEYLDKSDPQRNGCTVPVQCRVL